MKRTPVSALLLVALAAGCGVSTERHANATNDAAVPFGLLDRSAVPLVPPPAGPIADPVALCFVRNGRLVVTLSSLTAPVSLQDTIEALAASPIGVDPPVRTAVTDISFVHDVKLAGGVARIDLDQRVSELSGEEQLLAVAQIVCTLTGRPGVGQASFSLEGVPLAVPRGDGALGTSPVARDDYSSLLD